MRCRMRVWFLGRQAKVSEHWLGRLRKDGALHRGPACARPIPIEFCAGLSREKAPR